jgi:hypothetical protein
VHNTILEDAVFFTSGFTAGHIRNMPSPVIRMEIERKLGHQIHWRADRPIRDRFLDAALKTS